MPHTVRHRFPPARRPIVAALALLAMMSPVAAHAQDANAARAAALPATRPPAATADTARVGPAFLTVRYASSAALTFYGGYHLGPATLFVGAVQNPRTPYREAIIGAGHTRTLGRQALFGALAFAAASDAPYLQGYLLPTLRTGPLELTGTLQWYEPLDRAGTRQFGSAPLNVHWVASDRLAFGASWVFGFAQGRAPEHAAGPSLRLGIPHGTLSLDLLRGLAGAPSEVRLTVFTAY